MGLAQYAIVPVQDEWGVLHDGDVKSRYATKEAAFESAVAAASWPFARDMKSMSACPAAKPATTRSVCRAPRRRTAFERRRPR